MRLAALIVFFKRLINNLYITQIALYLRDSFCNVRFIWRVEMRSMNLSFRQMEYICAIADTGSYCAAAKKLYVTQPTLSIAVKNIEKILETPLFIRKKSEVIPTAEGAIVLAYAHRILQLQKEMERKLYHQQEAHIKKFRIGIYSILNTLIIPPLLVRFKKKHPDIEISSIHGHYQALDHSLSKNNLDLIVCVQDQDNPLFDCIHLKKEHFLLAIPPEHAACKKAIVMENLPYPYLDIRELDQDPIFFQYPHQQIRWQENKLLEISGFHPKEIKEVESIQLAIQLASEKLGVAFTMESYIKSFHTQKPLAYYVTGDQKQTPWLTICTARGLSRDPVVQDCIEILRELVNER